MYISEIKAIKANPTTNNLVTLVAAMINAIEVHSRGL